MASNMNTADEEETDYETTRIMLSDCPKEMTKSSVHNMCIEFGKLAKPVHVPKKPGTFFVEYLTQSCAEQAIRCINENKELGIHAKFVRKQSNANGASNSHNRQRQPENDQENNKYQKPKTTMDQRSVKGRPFSKPVNLSQPEKKNETQSDPKQVKRNEGRFSRTTDDRHKVQNGRTSYQASETFPTTLKNANRSENNEEAHSLKEKAPTPKSILLGACVRCEQPAERQCSVCMDPYCSQECQRLDWPKHKKECRPMPELTLIQAVTPRPNQTNNNAQQKNFLNTVPQTAAVLPLPTPQPQKLDFPNIPPIQSPTYQKRNFQQQNRQQQQHPLARQQQQQQQQQQRTPAITQKLKAENMAIEPKKIQQTIGPFPQSGDMVTITSVASSGMIFIRSVSPKVNREYTQVLEDVAKYAATATFLTEKPKVNTFVLGNYEGTYYRAIVLHSNSTCADKDVRVAYLDFGKIAIIKWKELKHLTDLAVIGAVRHNFRVYLKNVDVSKHTNDNTMVFLNNCVDKGDDFEIIYEELDEKKREVALVRRHDRLSLSDKIKELSVIDEPITKVANVNDSSGCGSRVLVNKGVPNGYNLRLFILDTSLLEFGNITCILYSDKSKLLEIECKVKEYCSTVSEQYTPRRFELCLSKFENEWYRGFCIEGVGDQHPTICLIDYGFITSVANEDIRKIPIELARLPVYSKLCEIEGLPEDCTDLMPQLEEKFVQGQEIIVGEVKNVVSDSEDIMETYAVLKTKKIMETFKLQ